MRTISFWWLLYLQNFSLLFPAALAVLNSGFWLLSTGELLLFDWTLDPTCCKDWGFPLKEKPEKYVSHPVCFHYFKDHITSIFCQLLVVLQYLRQLCFIFCQEFIIANGRSIILVYATLLLPKARSKHFQ